MKLPDSLFNDLSCRARFAVYSAWKDATLCGRYSADEVDHVYAMTTTGVQDLAKLWAPILTSRRVSLRVTGVFCHQTPKAHFAHPIDGAKSPELADLLIVHEHNSVKSKSPIVRRAALIQAKKADRGVPPAVDVYQEYLYERWPEFVLKGRGPNGASFLKDPRTFQNCAEAGRYGLVESNLCRRHHAPFSFCRYASPWTYTEPMQPIRTVGGEDAGTFLANMLYDTKPLRGRTANAPKKLILDDRKENNHFDVTVEELLTVTARKSLRFKNRPNIKGQRGTSIFACTQFNEGNPSFLSNTGENFKTSKDGGEISPPEDHPEREYNDGISLILIETGEGE